MSSVGEGKIRLEIPREFYAWFDPGSWQGSDVAVFESAREFPVGAGLGGMAEHMTRIASDARFEQGAHVVEFAFPAPIWCSRSALSPTDRRRAAYAAARN